MRFHPTKEYMVLVTDQIVLFAFQVRHESPFQPTQKESGEG